MQVASQTRPYLSVNDHFVVVPGVILVDDTYIRVDEQSYKETGNIDNTRTCSECGVIKPIGAFTDKCKKKDKNGEIKTYTSVRRVCHKCRWASRKKAKTTK